MFPTIGPVKSSWPDRNKDATLGVAEDTRGGTPSGSIATILRAFGTSIDDDMPRDPLGETRTDWSILIDRIRATAARVRDLEAQARERDLEIEALLDRVRADMRIAEERVRAAEMHASRAEAMAADQLQVLEERARTAEERARVAEAWLKQIHETIASEFTVTDEVRA